MALSPPMRRPPPPARMAPTGLVRIRINPPRGGRSRRHRRIKEMEGSTSVRSWLRCYRCWSQNLEVQVHYEGIHRIDPETGERGEVVDESEGGACRCLWCRQAQP